MQDVLLKFLSSQFVCNFVGYLEVRRRICDLILPGLATTVLTCWPGLATVELQKTSNFSLHIFHPTCSGCLCAFKRIVFIFVFKWMMTLLEIAPLKQTLNWIFWLLFFWLSATAHICWQLVNGFQPPNNQVDCILVGDAEALKYFEVANTGNTNGQNTCGLTVRSPLFYDQNRPSQYNVSFVSFYTT